MKRVLLALIRFYRKYISPAFPGKCRFIPTCSEYGLEAIEKYGALRGGWLTFKRLLRCNPFNHGDFYDPRAVITRRISAHPFRPAAVRGQEEAFHGFYPRSLWLCAGILLWIPE